MVAKRAAVVVVDTQPAQLRADRGDVGLGGHPRVLPGLDGVLLGGQAEGVVAHRVQHVVAVHPAEPAGDVGAQVAQRVADVQARRPEGYGNMSITKNLGRSATRSKPALSRPVGFGVWNVPSAAHRSCQASSICWASAGV